LKLRLLTGCFEYSGFFVAFTVVPRARPKTCCAASHPSILMPASSAPALILRRWRVFPHSSRRYNSTPALKLYLFLNTLDWNKLRLKGS
jgi:hypothetical protein